MKRVYMGEATDNDHSQTDDQPDLEQWYDNVRVIGFEERYSKNGSLMKVVVTLRAEFFERGAEGPIPIDEEEFVMEAKPTDRHKHLRVIRFRPDRHEEASGLGYPEFDLFWEAVGELDARGFRVDTGAFEYGDSHLGV